MTEEHAQQILDTIKAQPVESQISFLLFMLILKRDDKTADSVKAAFPEVREEYNRALDYAMQKSPGDWSRFCW